MIVGSTNKQRKEPLVESGKLAKKIRKMKVQATRADLRPQNEPRCTFARSIHKLSDCERQCQKLARSLKKGFFLG